MSIFEFDDQQGVRTRGTLHAPGATPGDVLTVGTPHGAVSPSPGGGSQPAGLLLPVRAVEPIADITLSGEQTIDGVALIAGDRVLVAGQTDESENGVWVVSAGTWARPSDFALGATVLSGTCVYVTAGGALQGQLLISLLRFGGAGAGDPFLVGTDAIGVVVVADAQAFGFRGADGDVTPANQFNFNGVGLLAPWLLQSDPHNPGTLWNNGNVPTISTG